MSDKTRCAVAKWRDDEGATAVVIAVMITVLLGLGAFMIDAGALYAERRALQGAADAGALAGVQELPGNPSAAVPAANALAAENVAGLDVDGPTIVSELVGNDAVRCTVRDPSVTMMLARFINKETARVGATAVAKVQSPAAFSMGVMPFGIMSVEPSGTTPFGYPFGSTVTLKQPAKKGESGNYQFLSLTDPPLGHDGANDITSALRNGGVDNAVYINTNYNTKTGLNGSNVTKALKDLIQGDSHSFTQVAQQRPDGYVDLLDPDCPRVIVCPIIVDPGPPVAYNWFDLNGTSRPIRVIGFAYFFIESIGGSGNECWVIGRFIKPIDPDDAVIIWGPVDPYGSITYRLTD